MNVLTGVKKDIKKNILTAAIFVKGLTSVEYTTMITDSTTAAAFTDGYTMTSMITLEEAMSATYVASGDTTFNSGVCYASTATAATDKSAYCHVIEGIDTATDVTTIPQNGHAVRISLAAAYAKLKLATTTTAAATLETPTLPAYVTKLNADAGLKILGPVASSSWKATAAAPVTKGCHQCLMPVLTKPTPLKTNRGGIGILTA